MPEIQIRPANASDIPALAAIDHRYLSDYVWQIETTPRAHTDPLLTETVQAVRFRQVRLPRQAWVEYPGSPRRLLADWQTRPGLLVAVLQNQPVGYISMLLGPAPNTSWVTDLAVHWAVRRQGIGSALVLAALEWADQMSCRTLVLEMQARNFPAMQLAEKLGFEFCGYHDRYYADREVGIFYCKTLR
jgi:ribosomal protein S18 acetylase RimI-like enzyme